MHTHTASVDIESPAPRARALAIALEVQSLWQSTPNSRIWHSHIQIPVHLRYPAPCEKSDEAGVIVIIAHPLVFVRNAQLPASRAAGRHVYDLSHLQRRLTTGVPRSPDYSPTLTLAMGNGTVRLEVACARTEYRDTSLIVTFGLATVLCLSLLVRLGTGITL
jgi:hypothetical protein